jgi:hypothetical protein
MSHHPYIILFFMSFQDGCTLSNHPIVGVHNISKERLLIEFTDRRMPIPPLRYFVCPAPSGQAAVGVNVAKFHHLPGRGSQLFRGKVASFEDDFHGGSYTIHYDEIDMDSMDSSDLETSFNLGMTPEERENAYITSLRTILIRRLMDEEELERLTMYARDRRFTDDVNRPKWEPHRILIDMLHCLMRMHEKVLFLIYFAAMNRLSGTPERLLATLDSLSAQTRVIAKLPPKWTHTLDKDKKGNTKLLPFKMNYDTSKKIFNMKTLPGLYELIDIAVVSEEDNNNWRAFIVSYLNCMDKVTSSKEYTPKDIDELDVLCKKMYHLLVTTIGGLEACTNYFHIIGSGHVVWMAREYGNLWRYRNEGVEAFNKIVSLRYNKFNKRGGYKKTRAGDEKRKCNEFWSLGQWLGRWSLWHLGYADAMQHDTQNMTDVELNLCEDMDSDATYQREDDSDSDSSGSDVNIEDVASDALTFRRTSSCVNVSESISEDDDEHTHFNGVWYTSSNDIDSESDGDLCSGASCTDEDDATLNEPHISTNHVFHHACDLSTPFNLSTRESRAHRYYDRACNSVSHMVSEATTARYAVHAST